MRNSSEVFHSFFHPARDSGRCGNVSFVNPLPSKGSAPRRFYSYSTCVAEFYAGVCLVSACDYSSSTQRHIRGVRRASPVPVVVIGGGSRGSSTLLGCDPARAFTLSILSALDELAELPARAFSKRGVCLRKLSGLVDGWGVFSSATGAKGSRELASELRRARAVVESGGAELVEQAKRREAAQLKRERVRALLLNSALEKVGGLDGARGLFVSGGFDALVPLSDLGVSGSAIFPPSLPDLIHLRADGSLVTSRGVECSSEMLRAYVCRLAGGNDCGALAWGAPVNDGARVRVGCHSFAAEHLRAVGVLS